MCHDLKGSTELAGKVAVLIEVLPKGQKEAVKNPNTKFFSSLTEVTEALEGIKD